MNTSVIRPAIIALLLAGACTIREGGSDTSAAARVDTGNGLLAGTPSRVDSSPASMTSKLLPVGPDSASTRRTVGVDDHTRDSLYGPLAVDSAPAAHATGGDLELLRRELIIPLASVPASALHDTFNEMRDGTRHHEALDILAPRGTPVRSAASGRLLKMFNSKAGGLMVYAADSSERFILMYAHLDAYQPGLVEGQRLTQGQPIGFVGTTGNAPANTPHLHFAIASSSNVKQWWKGVPVNPYPLLAR